MAEPNKTEKATPFRREKERKEGRLARSQEIPNATILLFAALIIALSHERVAHQFLVLYRENATYIARSPDTHARIIEYLRFLTTSTLLIVVPLLLALFALQAAVGLAQTRGLFTSKPLSPDFGRLNPAQGFKRVFGVRSVSNLLKQVAKMSLIGLVGYKVFAGSWDRMLSLTGANASAVGATIVSLTMSVLFKCGLLYMVIAAADYAFEWWQFEESIKMTKQEVKDEHKAMEGDPRNKGRIRSAMYATHRRRMLANVPRADLVIVNPTHRAIALKYELGRDFAPIVLAMGERKLALRIRAIAEKNNIPIFEDRPLAEALIKTATVGQFVPQDLWYAVIAIMRRLSKYNFGYPG